MNWQYDLYIFVLLGAAVTALLLAVSARRWRAAPGSTGFSFLMLAVAVWAFAASGEIAAVTPAAKIAWAKLSYLGVVNVSPLWFVFSLSYSRRASWLTPRRLVLLWLVPAAILVLAVTNEWHGLIWSSVTPAATALGTQLVYARAIGVWVHAVYAYTLLLLGTCVLILTAVLSAHLYRGQIAALVLACAAPWVGNLAYLFGWGPWPGLDLTPGAFALTGLVLALGLYRLQVLERVPMAHDVLFGVMNDGVLILDGRQHVLDINPAACAMAGLDLNVAIGKPIGEVLPALAERLSAAGAADHLAVSLQDGLDVQVQVTPLGNRHSDSDGHLIVLRDITARRRVQAALEESESKYRFLIDHSREAIYVVQDGIVVFANRMFALIAGIDEAQVVGKSILDFVAEQDRGLTLEHHRRLVSGATASSSAEYHIPHPDGRELWVLVNAVLIQWSGKPATLNFASDITERKQMEQDLVQTNNRLRAQLVETGNLHAQLQAQVTRDPLTQLYNRLYLDEILPKEISRARRSNYSLSVLMIDVDHFKRVNDTHGHEAGDSVMRALAAEILSLIRTGDTACRYGGDEIVCLLTDTALQEAGPRAEQLREAVAALSIPGPGPSIHVTLSIGVAAFPETGGDVDLILRAADRALYSAKAQGRNRVVLAHAATDVPQPD